MNAPPHDIDAERAVLGGMLIDSEAAGAAIAILCDGPAAFYDEAHRRIYMAMADIYGENDAIDSITLLDHLRASGDLDSSGGGAYISDLTGAVPTSANIEYYARIVLDCSQNRELAELGRRLQLTANNGTAATEIIADTQKELNKLQGDGSGLPFEELEDWREIANKPTRWVFDGIIPAEIVGCIAAPGGTGKSFLILTLALSAVTGKTLLPAFAPVGPMRVIALFGEDAFAQVARRLQSVAYVFENALDHDEVDAAINDRLRLLCGNAKPLTETKDGTVRASAFYYRLLAQAKTADLILIDPLSKFHGLPTENDNVGASQLMNLIQGLAASNGATVLFAHHFNKAAMKERDTDRQAAPRGASAFIDESRWAAVLQVFNDDLARRFDIDPIDAGRYLELQVVKDNYSQRLAEPVYLKRFKGGALRQTDIRDERHRVIATAMAKWMADKSLILNKRRVQENTKEGDCKKLQDALRDLVGGKVVRDDRRAAVRWGLDNGVLKMTASGGGNNPEKLIGPGENYVPS